MGVHPRRQLPLPGQESVWDYPRPPRLETFDGEITVELGGEVIAATPRGWRVLETSHPPTYYLPREAFRRRVSVLSPARLAETCRVLAEATGC